MATSGERVMSSPAFDSLIRELARDPRPPSYADMAVIIAEYPEIPAEAIAEYHEDVIRTLKYETGVLPYLGTLLAMRMQATCLAYIEADVTAMRAQIDIEDAEDDRYTRRAV